MEDDLRPLVKSAMETGRSTSRKALREERDKKKTKSQPAKPSSPEPEPTKAPQPKPSTSHTDRPKEFQPASTSAPKRLNDIAQAPPELKKRPRGAPTGVGASKGDGILSMAQKAMMEEERLKAIARYRELKSKRSHKPTDALAQHDAHP